MSAARKIMAADLFCGAGGTSMGLARACEDLDVAVELLAINHWERAIETHTRNHPWARHMCANLEALDPRKVVPGGRLDLLVASPECTNHSKARGGRPINDQSRASAYRVLEWCDKLYVRNVLIENVDDFLQWGPIDTHGRAIRSRKGELFQAFIGHLRALNYRVEWRVLNAADFGGATTRRRLFILAKKGNRPITWPKPTHSRTPGPHLFDGQLKPWRAAREIIDWSLPGESIFTRKRPLARTTIDRIAAGLRKFCGEIAEPFLVLLYGTGKARSVDRPLPTVTAEGQHIGLAQPFVVKTSHKGGNGSYVRPVDQPLQTVTTAPQEQALVQPAFILQQQSGGAPRSTDEPLPTVACAGAIGLVEPFIVPPLGYHSRNGKANRPRSTKEPLQTVTSRGGGHLVEPFIVQANHGDGKDRKGRRRGNGGRVRSIEAPLPVVTAGGNGLAVVQPFIVGTGGPARAGKPQSVKRPLGTVLARNHKALVEPHLVKFYGSKNGQHQSVREPLHTVMTKDRFGLVEPGVTAVGLDIRFRMLQPHELAAAMGFERYEFTGNRAEQIRQIGNAVQVDVAKALCKAILEA